MTIEHLPANSPSEKISGILARDGCVVIDCVLDRATIDVIRNEVGPHLEAAEKGANDFDGVERPGESPATMA